VTEAAADVLLTTAELARRPDFRLGDVMVSPSRRAIIAGGVHEPVEPRVMQVLVVLAEAEGRVVTRDQLFRRCWGSLAAGDDSLNRAIASIRRLAEVAGRSFAVETIHGTGYLLTHKAALDPVDRAIEEGWQSWRLGLPAPDRNRILMLRQSVTLAPERADAWGMLALMLRSAVEYAEPAQCAAWVEECEAAAARALALEPGQSHARAALIGLPPLFGDWTARRRQLVAAAESGDAPILHDLAVLEMATGRPSAAAPIIADLIARDPLAAIFHYKRVYHLWTAGELGEMDRLADRAMILWPRHSAIWHARVWTLAFTGRAGAALAQIEDDAARPDLPAGALQLLRMTVAALAQAPASERGLDEATRVNLAAAARGPAQSVAAIIHLAGLGAIDAAFEVAEGYLLRRGPLVVPLHHTSADPSITDQHRRVTQMLFLPVTAPMRAEPRFLPLCEAMGLAGYWRAAGIIPDFLRDAPGRVVPASVSSARSPARK